ncbi:polysaccharide deacetylase family protein [Paracoccus sp. MBLB3053]|uniref:Chitooligosaccharide deacetylase n=1 Tax=Paracoccus aurantius TaxID=3073814 RepID=A0ABU2HYE9_9RHOB|nr:polysaccharide deacetylase family protein [Paracoccus sp. MBLB3053]MDS9470083.1 polysaccharide deacetylase family protein [Paracoccus sp. MBLB3053]
MRERDLAERALADRAVAGVPVQFWWRDDDAVSPEPALDRLLAMANAFDAALTLAVIPAPWNSRASGPELADRLADEPLVRVAVHGWSHRNHAPEGRKRQEFSPDRANEEMRDELRRGLTKLQELHGARALPLLVPPWNRIAPALLKHLAEDGFRAISTFGPETEVRGLRVVNTHLDVIDWRGGRVACDPEAMWREIRFRAESGRAFSGLLTHHLVHGEDTWSFIAELIGATKANGAVWLPFDEISDA